MADNPTAFPQGNEWMDAEGNMRLAHEGGMTLRDYFAGQALPPIVNLMMPSIPNEQKEQFSSMVSAAAYEIADAMLAARSST